MYTVDFSIPIANPDPTVTTYTVELYQYNITSGQRELYYTVSGVPESDFPIDIPGGVQDGFRYDYGVQREGVHGNRSVSFGDRSLGDTGKYMYIVAGNV